MYPTAERLLEHCDAVLRLPGASKGADQDVAIARRREIPVYHRLDDVPGCAAGSSNVKRAPASQSSHVTLP